MIAREMPVDREAARRALYAGTAFLLAPTAASRALAEDALALLASELGVDDVRAAHARMPNDAFFARIGRVRRALYLEPRWHEAVRDVVAAAGFDPARVAFDPLRLRVIAHKGHDNPLAAPVYYPHRDTWYGHPQTLLTWWIPLHDLSPDETFVFYPERFDRPVPNDSEIFDYDKWTKDGWSLKIGWQDLRAGATARYPGVVGEVSCGEAIGFGCRAGDNLVFSGAQFHRTLPQERGRTRYSLDFRLVHLGDEARGLGAPNVDSRCRGSALRDYVYPPRM